MKAELELISFDEALKGVINSNKCHILLGNGFSRAWKDSIFSYGSLLESADFSNLSPHARKAFDALKTSDFEAVMFTLRKAAALVRLYSVDNKALATTFEADAKGLRAVLVQTIASKHPARPTAVSEREYGNARKFLSNFERVYTLNYDLLLYWALMHEEIQPNLKSDDGFREPDKGQQEYVTWEIENTNKQNIYYLHGAIHLFDAGDEIKKFTWSNTGIALIDQIKSALENSLYPLFVSESDSTKKLARIKHSDILSRAYRSFANIGGSLFTYGCAFSPSDEHILRLIEKNKCAQLFVSIFGQPNSVENVRIRKRVLQIRKSRTKKRPLDLFFYNAASAKVWRG